MAKNIFSGHILQTIERWRLVQNNASLRSQKPEMRYRYLGIYGQVSFLMLGDADNGEAALPGANECFASLAKAGKKMVILSNTSRRSANAVSKLPGMGFDVHSTRGLVSSGEEAWKHIR